MNKYIIQKNVSHIKPPEKVHLLTPPAKGEEKKEINLNEVLQQISAQQARIIKGKNALAAKLDAISVRLGTFLVNYLGKTQRYNQEETIRSLLVSFVSLEWLPTFLGFGNQKAHSSQEFATSYSAVLPSPTTSSIFFMKS